MDFIGFTYNGYHSIRDLGIYRTSDGSRYTEDLAPTMEDKTAEVPGADGMYYFGTRFKERTFNVQYAFDGLTESGLARLKEAFRGDGIHDLIFDEAPYKVWGAKVTGSAQIKHLCFEENGERVYKGEGSITFTCYYPYAHTPVLEGSIVEDKNVPISEYITASIFVPKGYYIRNESGVSITVAYRVQDGDIWKNKIEEKTILPYSSANQLEVISTTSNTLIIKVKFLSKITGESRITMLPNDGYSSSCAFVYTSSGYIEHISVRDGRDINSYFLSEHPNKNEWIISSNLVTQVYNNLVQHKGAINRGQLPAHFQLTASSITFSSTNPKLKIGDCEVVLSVEKDTKYEGFIWDSKTGIIKAKDTAGKTIYFSYTGDSVGTIPVNTTGIYIEYPETMTLNYHYWYL